MPHITICSRFCYEAPKGACWVCDYSSHFSFRTVLDFLSSISRLNASLPFHSEHYIMLQHQHRRVPIKETIVGFFLLASSWSPGSTWWSFCIVKNEKFYRLQITRNTFPTTFARQAINRTRGLLSQVAHRRCACLLQISESSTVLLQGQHSHYSLSQLQYSGKRLPRGSSIYFQKCCDVVAPQLRTMDIMLIMETLCILVITCTRKIIPRCIRIKLLSGAVLTAEHKCSLLSTCLERGAWMAQLREHAWMA